MIKVTHSAEQLKWYSKVHRSLLPQDPEIGVMPYIWLCYLLMYLIPFFFVDFTSQQYLYSVIAITLFLFLYFKVFWVTDKQLFFYLAAIWTIGFILALQEMPGASVFTVYTAAFTAQFNKPKTGFITLAIIILLNPIISHAFGVSPYIYGPGSFFGFIVGVSNIFMSEIAKKNRQIKASQEEIKKIATSAERERIARDLHDLIGHTFSVINIKSQLAQKLVKHDVEKATQEIIEIEKISRASLSQIREVVSDYRQRDLTTELSQARILLDSLDIHVNVDITPIEQLNLTAEQNTTLAYIVRELTTNIMRHGQATDCTIKLEENDQFINLTLKNNGDFKKIIEGSGLKGIRERAEQLNGHATFQINQGFVAHIKFPNASTHD